MPNASRILLSIDKRFDTKKKEVLYGNTKQKKGKKIFYVEICKVSPDLIRRQLALVDDDVRGQTAYVKARSWARNPMRHFLSEHKNLKNNELQRWEKGNKDCADLGKFSERQCASVCGVDWIIKSYQNLLRSGNGKRGIWAKICPPRFHKALMQSLTNRPCIDFHPSNPRVNFFFSRFIRMGVGEGRYIRRAKQHLASTS